MYKLQYTEKIRDIKQAVKEKPSSRAINAPIFIISNIVINIYA